jgi:hypothetical protein
MVLAQYAPPASGTQSVCPEAHELEHMLPTHAYPALHVLPQPPQLPQLLESVAVAAQKGLPPSPGHCVVPGPQFAAHCPPVHS